jgi:hypothetical protein
MKYTSLFGSKLILKRTVKLKYLSDDIEIDDTLTNESFSDDEYMLLYHFNFGYPMIDENSTVEVIGAKNTAAVNQAGKTGDHKKLEYPLVKKAEEVYCHTFTGGKAAVKLKGKYRLTMSFDAEKLPYLMQWKSMACGDYALGLEPSTTELNDKKLKPIKPFESHDYSIKLTIDLF